MQVIDQTIISEVLGKIKVFYCLIYVLSIGNGSQGSPPVNKDTQLQSHDGDRITFEVMTPIYIEYKHIFCGTSVIK